MNMSMDVVRFYLGGYAVKSSCIPIIVLIAFFMMMRAPAGEAEGKIDELINKLAETADGDVGFSSSMSGRKFAPLEGRGEAGAMLLGQ